MDEREALIQEYERLHKEADRLFQQWLALICPGIDVEALRQLNSKRSGPAIRVTFTQMPQNGR